MIGNPYQAYQSNSVMTASQGELTLMLYNGAVRFCNQAIESLENKNIQKAHINNIKVQDIIAELQSTLDFSYPIAKELDNLYFFIRELLISSNIEKDIEKLKQARDLIVEFRDMWKQVMGKSS
jgi:flagellar protein FliS